jgi:hypothetical protein
VVLKPDNSSNNNSNSRGKAEASNIKDNYFFFVFYALSMFICCLFYGLMSETIEFELVRPVNPTGSSFIRYV